jgi:uncharacterized iron-regulated protein
MLAGVFDRDTKSCNGGKKLRKTLTLRASGGILLSLLLKMQKTWVEDPGSSARILWPRSQDGDRVKRW